MSSSRPEVHFQLASAAPAPTPPPNELAQALGLPPDSDNDTIMNQIAALQAFAQKVAAGTAGQSEAQALLKNNVKVP